jgi:hypothetical protein
MIAWVASIVAPAADNRAEIDGMVSRHTADYTFVTALSLWAKQTGSAKSNIEAAAGLERQQNSGVGGRPRR